MRHGHSARDATSCTNVLWFDLVQRTAHGQSASIQHMRLHHGGLHIFVPEEFLDGPDVVALLEELRRETVPKGMTTDAFVEPHRMPCLIHSLLQSTLTRMMTPGDPRA